jgi:hypothetical protein
LSPMNVCALKQQPHRVALGDGEGDLLADLGVEAAAGERATEVEITLQRGWRSAEDAEKVRHDAQCALHAVEELLGFAPRLCRVELSDAVHVPNFDDGFVVRPNAALSLYTQAACQNS